MRTIRISDVVWDAIAARGKFGETADDVLRRVFELHEEDKAMSMPTAYHGVGQRGRGNRRFANKKMSQRVEADAHGARLVVEFVEDGVRKSWQLPDRGDKQEIRRVRDDAVSWATENGASVPGQTNAIHKALTENGYHLVGPRWKQSPDGSGNYELLDEL